jgi:hypothetical protein
VVQAVAHEMGQRVGGYSSARLKIRLTFGRTIGGASWPAISFPKSQI